MKITKGMLEKAGLDPALLDDPQFVALAEEGLAIQERFVAEPIYARTGVGYLKSVGVAEIEAAKNVRPLSTKD